MPLREQQGPLVLRRKGMAISGTWVPYWRYDAICLEKSLADEAAARFTLDLRPVQFRGPPQGPASQIGIPTVGIQCFDVDEIRAASVARNGADGNLCLGLALASPRDFDFAEVTMASPR